MNLYIILFLFFKHLRHNNISKVLSYNLFLLGVEICIQLLNSRSTGADEGKVVLYLKNTFLMIGKDSNTLNFFFFLQF